MENGNTYFTAKRVEMRLNTNPIPRRGNLAVADGAIVFGDKWTFGTNLIVSKIQARNGDLVIPFGDITKVEMGKYMMVYPDLRIYTRDGNVYRFIDGSLGGIGKSKMNEAERVIRGLLHI